MTVKQIVAPKWLVETVGVYNRHIEQENKLEKKIAAYLERIDYSTETGWDGRYSMKFVDGEITEKNGKNILKVEGSPPAEQNRDGVFVHQVQGYHSDSYSGEFYIPCEEAGKYIQVHFSM